MTDLYAGAAAIFLCIAFVAVFDWFSVFWEKPESYYQ